ncbi:TPA: hypothetical protein ACH3X3_003023 [Trebouxia sp. C0006]
MVLCFSVLQHLAHAAAHQSPSYMAGWGRNLIKVHTVQRARSAQARHLKVVPPVCMGRRSSKIATRKTSQDACKAKLYGKIGKLIVQAVKAGGTDVVGNPRLKEVLKQAQQASIPKDIIERNITRASDKSQADFQEVTYEAYGAGGTGFILECLTDNLNRSASEVRAAVMKAGGKMADPGSVMFNFQRQGQVFVSSEASEDQVFEVATDAGADDIVPANDEDDHLEGYKVLTDLTNYAKLYRGLQAAALPLVEDRSGLVYNPLSSVECDDQAYDQNEQMLERLLAVDDVDDVHTNCAGLR